MATVTGTGLSGSIGACEYIEDIDPWSRDHGQALAANPSRVAPILIFDNTSHEFHNMTLDNAVDETIEYFYDEQLSNTATLTINRASDILIHEFESALDEHSLTLYYDAYNIMMEAAVKGVETGEITLSGSIPTAIQTVINTQDYMLTQINDGYTSDRYESKYSISMNKAMMYRLVNKHSIALTELDNIQAWVATKDVFDLDYVTCHTQYELDIIQGVIDAYNVDLDTVYTCVDTVIEGSGGGSVPVISSIQERYQESDFKVFPNPSSGLSVIQLTQTKAAAYPFTIYSLNGQKLQSGNLEFNQQGKATLDYQTLASGVYILELTIDDKLYQNKLFKE